MEGVEIAVSCGRGTLMPTGRAVSGPEGEYRLSFGPAMVEHDGAGKVDVLKTIERTVPQAATVSARKAGFFEKNLGRQGDLSMARERPNEQRRSRFAPERTVLPHQPKQVDFVLLPAARVTGRVLDGQGRPVAGQRLYIDGDELGPSASVLGEFRPNEDGRFTLSDVPLRTYWFEPADGEFRGRRSEPVSFDKPGGHEVELVLDPGKGSLAARVVEKP